MPQSVGVYCIDIKNKYKTGLNGKFSLVSFKFVQKVTFGLIEVGCKSYGVNGEHYAGDNQNRRYGKRSNGG